MSVKMAMQISAMAIAAFNNTVTDSDETKRKNTLASEYPEVAAEWNYEKNGDLTPEMVAAHSSKKVWWKCKKGHEWQANIDQRTRGSGCPICAGRQVLAGYNDLSTSNPELASEWNYEKNGDLTPEMVTAGSGKKVWWVCEEGHEWEAVISSRSKGHGCPICGIEKSAKTQSLATKGVNDLTTTNPELASEWDYAKNGDLTPEMVMAGSGKKVWWKGKCGHEWQASIDHRSRGRGCPICAKEKRTSYPEQTIYYYIKQVFSDAINGDRTVLDGKELDIYIPSLSVGVEYDGVAWHQDTERDNAKDRLCEEKGVKLIRVREAGCPALDNLVNLTVISRIDNTADESLDSVINEVCACLGCTVDINIARDKTEILAMYAQDKAEKSLARTNPELCKEWNYVKNGDLTPEMVIAGSEMQVWWICEKGHEWQARIDHRSKNIGCPICAGYRPVKNLDTGVIYQSSTEAAKAVGLKSCTSISNCCKSLSRTAAGYHWAYAS